MKFKGRGAAGEAVGSLLFCASMRVEAPQLKGRIWGEKRGQNSSAGGGVRVDKTAGFNGEQEENSENVEGGDSPKFAQNLRELDEK